MTATSLEAQAPAQVPGPIGQAANALVAAIAYLFIVGEIKRVQLKAA
ncbi:hypothetical protein HAP54_000020980 [Bradyrhizobium sp. 2S1]|nr:hypothetical protein [Bradyrhizobium sp. 2S1]MCK7672965.1 hypothetical protein [Bradyrhizobium sp. 2S1]